MRRVHPEGLALRLAACVATGLLASCGRPAMPESVEGKLDRAAQEVAFLSFDRAEPLFLAAMAQAPEGSDAWQQAAYGAGVCAQQRMPPSEATVSEARALYQRLIDKTPQSRFAPRAMLNLGRLCEVPYYRGEPLDLPQARTWYQRVIDTWPEQDIAGEATFRLAATYVQTYQNDDVLKGIGLLEAWLTRHLSEPLASAMYAYIGDAYFSPLKDYPKSLAAYKNCSRLGWMDKGSQQGTYWRMAKMAEMLQPPDRDTAIEYYTRIIRETPNGGKAYEAQLALKRLGAKDIPPIELYPQVGSQTAPAPQAQGPQAQAPASAHTHAPEARHD